MDDHPLRLPVDLFHDFFRGRYKYFLPALFHDVDVIAAGLEDIYDRAELLAVLGNHFHADEFEPVVRAFRKLDGFFFRDLDEPPVDRLRLFRRIITTEEKKWRAARIPYRFHFAGDLFPRGRNEIHTGQTREPLREIRHGLDLHLAFDAEGLDHFADGDKHAYRQSAWSVAHSGKDQTTRFALSALRYACSSAYFASACCFMTP